MKGRVLYSAEREGTRFVGTIEEIAALVGKPEYSLYKMIERKHTTESGWQLGRDADCQWRYVAEKPWEDPIIGSAAEVACLLGITSSYVYIMAKSGRRGNHGWRIQRRLVPVNDKGGKNGHTD